MFRLLKKRVWRKAIVSSFLLVSALMVSSCASLVQPLPFELNVVPSSSGKLGNASLRAHDSQVYVYGRLFYGSEPGHVDVLIATPEGELTCQSGVFTSGQHRSHFRGTSGLHGRHSRKQFQIELDEMPPVNSLLQVSHHEGEVHQSCQSDEGNLGSA